MMVDYDGSGGVAVEPRRRSLWSWLILPLVAFLLGLAAMGWLLTRWTAAAAFLGIAPEPAPAPPAPVVQAEQPVQPQIQPQTVVGSAPGEAGEIQRFVIDPQTQQRVALLEQRLAQIDTQSRAAVGNADRAEALLVAFAARRALDRGVALGYIEHLLRERFGRDQPQAVGTVITAARSPVTLQELQRDFQEIAPQLTSAGPNQGWWTALKAELGGLITVRREGTQSTLPADRRRRALRHLEAGEVNLALVEVMRMPGQAQARSWTERARRYVSVRAALDTIETAALLDPAPQPHAQPAPPPQVQRPQAQPQPQPGR